MDTTQDIAIVVCGGGNPMDEYFDTRCLIDGLGLKYRIYVGNDQIGAFPHDIVHAATLHPDKLPLWLGQRKQNRFNDPPHIWAHRPFNSVTNWTKDWQGSTGLFCTKIAREQGHTHVVLCGVPMTVEGKHFVRKTDWSAAHGFRRGWTNHLTDLQPYVRSWGGWTEELFGKPTDMWLETSIVDEHRLDVFPPGLKA